MANVCSRMFIRSSLQANHPLFCYEIAARISLWNMIEEALILSCGWCFASPLYVAMKLEQSKQSACSWQRLTIILKIFHEIHLRWGSLKHTDSVQRWQMCNVRSLRILRKFDLICALHASSKMVASEFMKINPSNWRQPWHNSIPCSQDCACRPMLRSCKHVALRDVVTNTLFCIFLVSCVLTRRLWE